MHTLLLSERNPLQFMKRNNMRISHETILILLGLAHQYFGDEPQVRLFGSRTNDDAKGGDIDLRVQRNTPLLIDHIAIKNGILLHE